MIKLTDNQKFSLVNASRREDGNIEPLPDNINAGIKSNFIKNLLAKDVIEEKNGIYVITEIGLSAIATETPKPSSKVRQGTKQHTMLTLMERPEGASIDEICKETQWLAHTVRGTFANVIKKRLGLEIYSKKDDNNIRKYRVGSDFEKSDKVLDNASG